MVLPRLWAQEVNEIEPPVEDEVVVGAIGGTVDVSALGGAVYSIPIQVPEGMGGVQPNLSIVYNSQSGNGLLGWGWSLGGLSAITRVGQTNYHDGKVTGVSLDYRDRFALDGQRLMVLDGLTYGSNNAEYRTEVDGMSKIVSYTESGFIGPKCFKVFTADGLVMEYGNAVNARVVHNNDVDSQTVVIWLLNRVEDRNGNYMVYNYIIDDVGHNYRLGNIQYCANSHVQDAGQMERGTKYGIDFHYYSNRIDKESMAIGNHLLYQPWLLSDISIYHWNQPLSKYEFVYDENSGQVNSYNYYNRLVRIKYEYEDLSLNPTIINWGEYPEINNGSNNIFFSEIDEMYVSPINYYSHGSVTTDGVVKFAGDFNGDGLQDLICTVKDNNWVEDRSITDSIGMDNRGVHRAHAFINKGHTKTDDEAGELYFEQIGTFEIPYNLRWIYVCDLDGDGIDEVLFVGENTDPNNLLSRANYDVFKLCQNTRDTVRNESETRNNDRYAVSYTPNDNSEFTFSIFGYGSEYIWENGDVFEFRITKDKNYSFIVGDFLGKGHCDIIFAFPYKHYVYLYYDEQSHSFRQRTSVTDWNGVKYVPGDFDGDGRTEVWFDNEFDTAPGVIAKVYIDIEGNYSWFPVANMMDKWNRNYTGDFNGDGHTDFLTFRKDTKTWQILLFKQDWHSYPVFDVTGIMHQYFGDEDPNDANYSIEGKEGLDYYIEIVDVNGDGKSDVMLRNKLETSSCKFAVLYGPPIGNGFSRIEEFDAEDILIQQESTPGLCVGNFLGQENMALISKGNLYSFPQHSIYYNVKDITDGMGNRASFDYEYLIHNPMKNNNIYTINSIGQNLGFELYNTPMPTKAVKSLSSYNVNLATQAHDVALFSYANAIIHRKGKGLLGFANTTRDVWQIIPTSKESQYKRHQSKLERTFNFEPMKEHRALVLESEVAYRYKDDEEEVETLSTNYEYAKGLCQRDMNSLGVKVFIPLAVKTITDEFNLLGERTHLRRRIAENEYDGSQAATGTINYQNVVRVVEVRNGTDPGLVGTVANCEFQNSSHTVYAPILNSSTLWVPNRPQSVLTRSTRRTTGYADSRLLTVYFYDSDKPYLPTFVNTYPSGVEDEHDPLAMTAYYTYYPTGRLKDESHYPVVGRSEDGFKTMYEYSTDYRFLTKKTEEYDLTHTKDYETLYSYDNVYGEMETETDCNGYSTYTENPDHLGLTVRSYKLDNDANQSRIPGTETVTALRWLAGSAYQIHAEGLTCPKYFSWKQRSGSADELIIYDAMGRELRTVSHGLPENGVDKVIYQDKQYDVWGRLYKISEPYFKGLPMGQRKWTTYAYGDFDRIEVVYDPQFTVDNQTIEPYTRYDYDGLVTKVTTGVAGNAQTHITQTTFNIMGWTDSKAETIDESGTNNVITYGYNANGSLAWTKVNGMETTKVSISYDNAGNRTGLVDPDYGQVTSQYNAFGQLVQTVSPKGDVTVYQYDNMGRKKLIIETDNNNASQPDRITTWNYSEAAGSKGLLTNVSLREGDVEKQVVAFNYDAQHYNRQASTTETLFGTTYTTTYSYDDQNGFPLRVKEVTYPSGYAIEKGYDATTGNVTEIRHNNQLLWKTHEANALGQITHYEMGNGVHSYYQYDDRHLLSAQQASKNGNIIQNFGYSYDIFANLAARTEDKFAMPNTETFTYDYLNRLTTVTLNGTTDSDMTYDDLGRILAKEADGQAVFSGAQYNTYDQHGNLKPHAVSSATMAGNPFASPSLDIAYTMFDKVKTLSQYDENENLVGQVAYQYGYDHERIQMTQGNSYEKLYVGNCELITQNGNAQWNTFISGPMGVFAAVTSNGTTESLRYIYKDHLGSWTTLTDDQGTVLQELSFDAWGNLRASASWSGQYNGVLLYDRGFTGHEHLFSFGLINMNGRIYDPVMSSFLSVDNYVQAPDFSQSFNRYAYCLNNPLKYTDPDGEIALTTLAMVGIGIATVMGGYTGYNIAVSKGYGFDDWQTYGYILGGAAIGFAAGYTGAYLVAGGGFMANTAGIYASSLVNCTGMTMLSGGSYSPPISFGAVSYDPMTGEWGYLGKKGNSPWQNIGYAFGALANLQDVVAGVNGTNIDVKSRPKLFGHSELGDYSKNDILVSNRPNWDIDAYNNLPFKEETGVSLIDDYNWEMTFVKEQFKGNPFPGKNASVIKTREPVVNVSLTNVNGKIMRAMTNNLNNGRNLLNIGNLQYGIGYGCVNMTSRALLYSGVINANAFLPITSPLFLQAELAIRQLGIYANPYLIQKI